MFSHGTSISRSNKYISMLGREELYEGVRINVVSFKTQIQIFYYCKAELLFPLVHLHHSQLFFSYPAGMFFAVGVGCSCVNCGLRPVQNQGFHSTCECLVTGGKRCLLISEPGSVTWKVKDYFDDYKSRNQTGRSGHPPSIHIDVHTHTFTNLNNPRKEGYRCSHHHPLIIYCWGICGIAIPSAIIWDQPGDDSSHHEAQDREGTWAAQGTC